MLEQRIRSFKRASVKDDSGFCHFKSGYSECGFYRRCPSLFLSRDGEPMEAFLDRIERHPRLKYFECMIRNVMTSACGREETPLSARSKVGRSPEVVAQFFGPARQPNFECS